MAKMFKRGYKAVQQEKERQEKAKENSGRKLFRFFLSKDGDEAEVRFLTEEPITFSEHTVKKNVNGKEVYDNVPCSGDDCKLCQDGNRPTFKGAYLIIDRREYTDKDKKKHTDQLRLYVQGAKVLSQLDRISTRYGLSNREVNIIRLGSGTSTTYTIEKGDEQKLTKKEIENCLPDFLKEKYDGTMDSLYSIIEELIEQELPDSSLDDDEEDEVEDNRRNLVSADDDEEEDERPVKKSSKLMIGKKRTENSPKSKLRRK